MTALPTASSQPSVRRQPSTRRLVAAAIVGSLGVIVLSIAVGANVASTRMTLAASAAADARALGGWVPAIGAIGLAHFLVAAALIRGRDVLRLAAAALTGIVALAAGTAAAMLVAGVDPLGSSAIGHPSRAGIGILAVAAALYGVAALVAGSGPAED
jgi:hypothetical protein